MPQCTRSNTFSPFTPATANTAAISYISVPWAAARVFISLHTSGLSHSDAIVLIKETVRFIADYDGKIPGTEPKECGNYREHDLAGAKKLCVDYYEKIKDWTEDKLAYIK